jgi:hypothetical protein
MSSQASSQRGHYPPDFILQAVHLVALHGRSDRKSLKLLDLEFANSIHSGMFYERGGQEKKLLLIWQPENFSDSQPRDIDYH